MALSTLFHGRRIWCSLINNHHTMATSPSFLRTLTRDATIMRGSWQSCHQSRSHFLRNKIGPVRCLATGDNNDPNQKESTENRKTGKLGLVALGASFLLGKAKYAFVALKFTKFVPLASMLFSSFAYSFFFGWPFAVGMVGLIAVHESGHAMAMRYYGVPFSPAVFIPFMGAVISMKDRPKNVLDEAVIALAGPVVGSAGAGALAVLGAMTDSQLCMGLADFGLMINLFNLLPIGSLDGGRICSALSPWFNVAGLGIGGAMLYTGAVGNPIFYLIMMGGVYNTASRFLGWDGEPHPSYYRIASQDKWRLGLAFAALIAALLWGMQKNNVRRKTYRQLQSEAETGIDSARHDDQPPRADGMKYDDFATEFFEDNFGTEEQDSWEQRYDERGRRIDGHRDWRSE